MALSPIRFIPPANRTKLASPNQVWAWMLAIQINDFEWEGYTSWDGPLLTPAYLDGLGNYTPPITFAPSVATLTRLPTQLKLGSQSGDVSIHAPRYDAIEEAGQSLTVFLDRDQILRGRYNAKHFELFEVDPETNLVDRTLWVVGQIGNLQLDDLAVTGELLSYDELANRVVGNLYHTICQVGALPGEDFGTGRCWNEVMNDGPFRPDWTAIATITAFEGELVTLTYPPESLGGPLLHPQFADRLANGAIEWAFAVSSGLHQQKHPIASGNSLGFNGEVYEVQIRTKLSLPYAPEIGEQVFLVAGCRRTKSDCNFYNNLKNMRAQDLPGNDDLQRRTQT